MVASLLLAPGDVGLVFFREHARNALSLCKFYRVYTGG